MHCQTAGFITAWIYTIIDQDFFDQNLNEAVLTFYSYLSNINLQ